MTRRNRRGRKRRRKNKSRRHVDAGKQRHENRLQTYWRKVKWGICDLWCWLRGGERWE